MALPGASEEDEWSSSEVRDGGEGEHDGEADDSHLTLDPLPSVSRPRLRPTSRQLVTVWAGCGANCFPPDLRNRLTVLMSMLGQGILWFKLRHENNLYGLFMQLFADRTTIDQESCL